MGAVEQVGEWSATRVTRRAHAMIRDRLETVDNPFTAITIEQNTRHALGDTSRAACSPAG
ncbi:hypothetical protein OG689_40950 [Kitasatospora sp. NBC_00240]|uniref:hypothetical protein n=1 Tax=Kitasatospora sp. NBC_00240 TaxID=2903567 RepID=UPI00224D1048|nr:hypothetical protein [Kitasatospora sp. NBC_00240]MCX5215536.1 hypothetical protein [Kitasatospora sp. NBC_00240]